MKQKKEATMTIAMIPVIFLIAFLLIAALVNNVWEIGWIDAHIPLLTAAFVAGGVAIFVLNYTWQELEEGVLELIKSAMGAIIILLIIGTVVGTWLMSGIVPSMIYYGAKILNPSIFLIVTLLLCSIVSLSTGSAWTTVATMGIALMGIGQGMGFPVPMIAGAIISGAYFGDKMSPLSDTTNLSPGIAGSDLFEHIRHMVYTSVPSYIIALIFFGVLGAKYGQGSLDQANLDAMLVALEGSFNLSPILLIAPLFVIALVIFKVPAMPGLFAGSVMGGILGIIFQGSTVIEIIDAMHYGFVVETGNAAVDKLVSGGGLDHMLWTISLIICAMIFGGVMETTGMLGAIANAILRRAKNNGDLIASTVLTCIAMNAVAGDQYLSIVIPGRMYREEYEKRGLHLKNLSRTLEDAGTLTSPLIPWNACGAYMIATLGVAPWVYVPFCIISLVNPIIAIIYGYTGYSIEKKMVIEEAV